MPRGACRTVGSFDDYLTQTNKRGTSGWYAGACRCPNRRSPQGSASLEEVFLTLMEQARNDCRYLDCDLEGMARTAVSTRQLACNYVELLPSVVIWYYLPSQLQAVLVIFITVGFVGWLPLLPVTAVIADTLLSGTPETLLASPLSEQASYW